MGTKAVVISFEALQKKREFFQEMEDYSRELSQLNHTSVCQQMQHLTSQLQHESFSNKFFYQGLRLLRETKNRTLHSLPHLGQQIQNMEELLLSKKSLISK